MEALAFHIHAEFQVMLTVEMRGGQKQVGRHLLPVPVPVHTAEVIAAIAVWRDLVDQVPARRIVELPTRVGEPDIEQRSAEVVLVANRTHVGRLVDVRRGLHRIQNVQPVAVGAGPVIQKARG